MKFHTVTQTKGSWWPDAIIAWQCREFAPTSECDNPHAVQSLNHVRLFADHLLGKHRDAVQGHIIARLPSDFTTDAAIIAVVGIP